MTFLWGIVPAWVKWFVAGCIVFSVYFASALIHFAYRLGRFRPYERLRRR